MKKIVFTPTFTKSLEKLVKHEKDEEAKNKLWHKLIKEPVYLKNWRKTFDVPYNKHDTLALAKAYCQINPHLTLYHAKLLVAESLWYDYGWVADILLKRVMRLPNEAKRLNQLLEYLDSYGETHYKKQQLPEYQKALDEWFDRLIETGEDRPDGSFETGEVKQSPILETSDEERSIAKREMDEETKAIGELMVKILVDHPSYQAPMATILHIWHKNYSHHAYNADWREVANQMRQAETDIIKQNYIDLAKQFSRLPGWWD